MKSQITIKKIQDLLLNGLEPKYVDDETSRRMWWAALEVVQKEFLFHHYQEGGIWIASPLPALNEKKYFANFKGWLWSPEGFPYFQKDSKGFLPPTNFLDLRRKNINVPKRYQSIFLPEESVWNKCWSLPILSFQEKKDLALNWNNS